MRKIIALTALMLLFPALSQAKSLEELLVEKGVITKGEAKSAGSAGGARVYWDKGTRVEFPDIGFTSGVAFFGQTRYEFIDNDEEAADSDNESSFSVKEARIILSGTALHNEFSYYLQGDFAQGDSAELKDMYFTWNACDWVNVKMGQWKTGISRQFNNSDWKLQFADRSVASDFFSLDRNQGLQGNWSLADGQFQLGAAIYNGNSDGEGINSEGTDTKHLGVVNARFNAMGEMDAYEEGDVNWTEDAALNIGAAYAYGQSENDFGELLGTADVDKQSLSVDANFKYTGWSAHGEFFWANYEPDFGGDSDADADATGFYAQVGYFIDPKTVELAVRYSIVDCDDGKAGVDPEGRECLGNDKINEASATINYYWWKHHLKAQIGYVFLNEDEATEGSDDGEDLNTNRWVVQLTGYM